MCRRRAWTAPDCSGQWFDGYEGHESVIFDDTDPTSFIMRATFLKLFDRYPMSVPIKGGFVEWHPRRAFITSNFHPNDLYHGDEAVLRRIDAIFEIKN